MLSRRINNELSYENAVQVYNLSPKQYHINIRKGLEDIYLSGDKRKVIDDMLVFDNARKNRDFGKISEVNSFCSLFDMSENTIRESYLNLLKGAPKLIPGLQISPKNCYTLLKIVFNHVFPNFYGMAREEQIETIDSQIKATYVGSSNNGIERWLSRHKLAGFINQGPYSSDRSPYKLLRWFDDKFSKEKNQSSWFDLNESQHLHFWEFSRDWSNDREVYLAIKHCLEEKIPEFKNSSREGQLKLIESYIFSKGINMKKRSRKFFEECGLAGMLRQKFKYAVNAIEFFDKIYSDEKRQFSYFDKTEKIYLEREKYDNTSDRLRAVETQRTEPQAL